MLALAAMEPSAPGASESRLCRRRQYFLTPLSTQGSGTAVLGETQSPISTHYTLLETLGRGSSGQVWRAKRKEDGREVALKFMSAPSEEVLASRRTEFEILRQLNHPNIVQCFDFISHGHSAVIAMSYHPGSTLLRAVKDSPQSRFSESVSQRLFRMLLSAMDYLHQRRIVHRDVKAENILVSPDLMDLHLADFNTAKALVDGGSLTMTGTMEYAAPEVLQGESPSEQHDVWGAGLCLHLMLTGRLPRYASSYHSSDAFVAAVITNPVTCKGGCWDEISEKGKQVVSLCLTISKLARPAAMTLLATSWLQSKSGCAPTAKRRFPDPEEWTSDDEIEEPRRFVRAATEPCGIGSK